MKIVSGGQTGADLGGLLAGKAAGLETGGWMPKGFLTEIGYKPDMEISFGVLEHISPKYPPRTYCNVRDSDGTIRFAVDFSSRGEICTFNAIKQYKKPYIDVDINNLKPVTDIVNWLKENNIQTLNVSGNKESTHPGMCEIVKNYLLEVIENIHT